MNEYLVIAISTLFLVDIILNYKISDVILCVISRNYKIHCHVVMAKNIRLFMCAFYYYFFHHDLLL